MRSVVAIVLAMCLAMPAAAAQPNDTLNAPDRVSACARAYPATAEMLMRRERETGVSARVMLAIAVIESDCRPEARGHAGEIGAFQEMPKEIYWSRPWISELMWPQPVLNVDGRQHRMMVQALEAHKLIQYSLVKNGGDISNALRVYNCGGSRGSACDRYAQRVLWLAEARR